MPVVLSDLRPGQRALVLTIAGEPPLVQRLSEFGIFDGEQLELVAFAPLGDPLEIPTTSKAPPPSQVQTPTSRRSNRFSAGRWSARGCVGR